MSSPVKFSYRIIINDSADFPYKVQRKGWLFWDTTGAFPTQHAAEQQIQKLANIDLMRPGRVVLEYNEQDHLAKKLRDA